MKYTFLQFVKFSFIGVFNVLIFLGIVYVLVGYFLLNGTLSNGLAYFLSAIFSYLANSFWTFIKPPSKTGLFKFMLVIVLLSSIASTITALVNFSGYHYYLSIFLIIFVLPIFSFFAHKKWSYAS